ncbi:MAG: ABC transporter permease, partial [Armatimonadota bacterium]|nr:ABC transporter permease [Armatimonadota bacterium]
MTEAARGVSQQEWGAAERSERGARYLWRRFRRRRLAVAALIYLGLIHLMAGLAPRLAPHPPNTMDLFKQFAPVSRDHILGTDESGRDVLSRLVFGARASLAVAFSAMVVAVTVGVTLGLFSGFYGAWVDVVAMRLTDGMLTVPTFFLALMILAVFGSGIVNVVLAIGLSGWMVVARVVRAEVLRVLPQEFVLASRAIGAGDR